MSEIADVAIVKILVADYAATDAAGKLNVIGGYVNTLGYNARAGQTAPFTLVVTVEVPPTQYNAEASVEVVLEDDTGQVVSFPTPTGEARPMRVGQAVTFTEPSTQSNVPRGIFPARMNWVMAFSNGLPLAAGNKYAWRVRVDGESRPEWGEVVYVPGMTPGPVFG